MSASIVRTPGVCGGHARIDGHRIRVSDVVAWRDHNQWTEAEMLGEFPQLGADEIRAALAYADARPAEMAEEMRRAGEIDDLAGEDIWSPKAIREAMRSLREAAYALESTGLTREGCAAMLPEYGDSIDELLRLAEDRGHLLRVRRLAADGRDHWRFFHLGRRP